MPYNMKKNALLFSLIIFVLPTSTNYSLRGYGFGSGGADDSSSNNYSLNAITGEVSSTQLTGSNYNALPGLEYQLMANTPAAPSLTSSNYYNKLLLTIDDGDNPTDAKFAIAVSTDNFVSETNYLQADNTIGGTLGSEDWQTYANWGGASGEFIVGLEPSTTYYVKVKVTHGDYSESPWSSVQSTATSALTVSFDIDVSATDQESAAPYIVNIGDLLAGSVTTSDEKIWVDLNTNAENGGFIYLYSSSGGLYSNSNDYTISAVSGDLSALNEGFGLQVVSTTQGSGGPLAAVAPYDGSGENVGIIGTSMQPIFGSTSAPISSGRGSISLKAKISDITPAASDYSDTLTVISVASF